MCACIASLFTTLFDLYSSVYTMNLTFLHIKHLCCPCNARWVAEIAQEKKVSRPPDYSLGVPRFWSSCIVLPVHFMSIAWNILNVLILHPFFISIIDQLVFWFMVFNATFNKISFISWRSVLLVEKTGETDKLYHIMLYREHLAKNVDQIGI